MNTLDTELNIVYICKKSTHEDMQTINSVVIIN